ncbi:MAG: helix-turn-helix domain-containing protein [Alphaproteobacteria bacterium]|nr:helix-turn-helix domain-containing protein [Alphaproteobacteria bacterium]
MNILTAAEAADFLKIKSDTLYTLIENDGLPGAKVGNQWRFLEEDLIVWFKRKQSFKQASKEDKWLGSGIYRGLVEDTFDAVLISKNNIIKDCNDAALSLYDYSMTEMVERPFHDLMAPEFHHKLEETLESNLTGIIQRVHIRRDGTVFPVEVSMKSLSGEQEGTRLGAVRKISHLDPKFFSAKVREVLSHYGVRSIEPGKLPSY